MRLLVVEDNPRLRTTLAASLREAGYSVDACATGEDGEEAANAAVYDGVVLDVVLPGRDGLSVLRHLRRAGNRVPVLLLTARDSIEDRVRGLDSGADDYLVKPFALDELLARLRALLRRDAPTKDGSLRVADLVLDPATHLVTRGDVPIVLTAREFALLELFTRHPNQVLTRAQAEAHVWGDDLEGASNVVDVYVRRLRRKVDDPFATKLLETLRGVGYKLRSTPT